MFKKWDSLFRYVRVGEGTQLEYVDRFAVWLERIKELTDLGKRLLDRGSASTTMSGEEQIENAITELEGCIPAFVANINVKPGARERALRWARRLKGLAAALEQA